MKVNGRLVGTLAALLVAALVVCGFAAAAAESPHAVVARLSARNKARAERDAGRRLTLVRLPPGAVASPTVPSGGNPELDGVGLEPTGGRFVARHAFWTAPESRPQVLAYMRHHLAPGARLGARFYGSGGAGFEIDWRNLPAGVWSATTFVRVVARLGGGSAIRADAWDWWELPRSPAARIPAGAGFLALRIEPTGEGIPLPLKPGEVEPPPAVPRFSSTEHGPLVAGLVRLIDRQPADQTTVLPSCGPDDVGSESFEVELIFMAHRGGRVLATASQQRPIGPCDPLILRLRNGGTYALESGWDVLRRLRGLIAAAQPRPAGS